MALNRRFTGSKGDLEEALTEAAGEQDGMAKGTVKEEAARRKGVAEGIRLALGIVRDWEAPATGGGDSSFGGLSVAHGGQAAQG